MWICLYTYICVHIIHMVVDIGIHIYNPSFLGEEKLLYWTFFLFQKVDLDLGNYERFLDIKLTRDNNITTGKIYQVYLVVSHTSIVTIQMFFLCVFVSS